MDAHTPSATPHPDAHARAQAAHRRKRMRAILDDALHVYETYAGARTGRARFLFEDTAAWFASNDRRWPVSFLNVCDALDLDPERVRDRLHHLAAAGEQMALIDLSAA